VVVFVLVFAVGFLVGCVRVSIMFCFNVRYKKALLLQGFFYWLINVVG
jgi:hypothetical protein